VVREAARLESDSVVSRQWQILKTSRVQGIGGTTGKALALSLIGGALYGVIMLVFRVTQ
jgi:hypothetical protein